MRVIDAGCGAISALPSDGIKVLSADTDVVDQYFVDATFGGSWREWNNWGVEKFGASSTGQDVPCGADAAESREVVGGVWWANIADTSDEEKSLIAYTSSILIYLIFFAEGGDFDVGYASLSVIEIAEDTDADT